MTWRVFPSDIWLNSILVSIEFLSIVVFNGLRSVLGQPLEYELRDHVFRSLQSQIQVHLDHNANGRLLLLLYHPVHSHHSLRSHNILGFRKLLHSSYFVLRRAKHDSGFPAHFAHVVASEEVSVLQRSVEVDYVIVHEVVLFGNVEFVHL